MKYHYAGALLLAVSLSFYDPVASLAISSETKDSASALADVARPLKTKLPTVSDKRPAAYIMEVQKSQTIRSIGSSPVEMVPRDSYPTKSALDSLSLVKPSDDASVALSRPPLKALISVQENLNPFCMDATASEKISLADCLRASTEENLDIARNFAGLRAQKYTYLEAASHFLPDINGGYNLIGLHGALPAGLLGGNSGSTSSGSDKLPGKAQLLTAGFTYTAYQGGKVLFGTLQQKHRLRASRAALKGSVNDVLLNTTSRYYDLLLNEALLDIRSRAVNISIEQVRINLSQEKSGTATGLDVLQSQAQLASDQQSLVDQQQARRRSAIQLAELMNVSFSQDFASVENELNKRRLVPRAYSVDKLLLAAIDNRPELKQYEELRLAAKRAIVVAAAPLQPKVALGGSVYGLGASGSGMTSIFLLNFSVNWTLGKLGMSDLANIQTARWQARQAAIDAKKIFQSVFEQVRIAYDQSLAAEKRIEHASAQIDAAEEELRIATKRMTAGVGLNLDVLNAQRDRTQAYINKAQAIVDFNVAQAQLLHDTGLISNQSLVVGARL